MLSAQPLELFLQLIASLPRLTDHMSKILLQLYLSLSESHDIHWQVFIHPFVDLSLSQLYSLT